MNLGLDPKTSVSFVLNGQSVTVDNTSTQLNLNEWIRARPGLSGTKKMCGEGGCGCCVVAAQFADPVTGKDKTIAINSCLCPLYSVEGWKITTVEGIGSSSSGLHPIQEKIVEYNGSQCGYCTPGFVMSMYSLLQENPKPTSQMVEDNFDGNICRCTGYRPILDAMKSFTSNAKDMQRESVDIEDIGSKLCPRTGEQCKSTELCRLRTMLPSPTDPLWYSPTTLEELSVLYTTNPDKTIKMISGDTGKGVFKFTEQVDIIVDLKGISRLSTYKVNETSLTVGATVSLSNLISLLQTNQSKSSSFQELANHLLHVASVPIRNVGSWAGNIMLTRDHSNFPSDVFTMMAGVGAKVTIASLDTLATTDCTLFDILQNKSNFVIISLTIPFSPAGQIVRSYKIMPRAVNAHAYVNATMSMTVDSSNSFTVTATPSLVFGGIGAYAIQATSSAAYLQGKSLTDPNTLKGVLVTLNKEIVPNVPPFAASVEYRKSLAISLFYKFYLAAIPGHISPMVQSAAVPYVRPISNGQQVYTPDPSEFPAGQPMTKLTAKLQASGEAQYTADMPTLPNELAAAFVLTTQANANITKIDSSSVEHMPGFVKLLTAADIPNGGRNSFVSPNVTSLPEEVFADKFSQYAGQSVALVIATTQEEADMMAQAVVVEYDSAGQPITTIEDAIRANSYINTPDQDKGIKTGDASSAISNSDHVISGQIMCGLQYHFHMETHSCLCIPEEEGYTVHCSTQWTANVQAAVAGILGITNNSVDVIVKRCGGGFGAKISRSSLAAAACALGAHITKKPVRMHMDLETNMKLIGKRCGYLATYQVGCTNDGILNGIKMQVYANVGWKLSPDDDCISLVLHHVDNVYHCPNWDVSVKITKINTATNIACRSPGTVPGIFIIESVMDHVARSLLKDVEEVKRLNFYKVNQVTPAGMILKYCIISTLWDKLYKSADVDSRKQQVEVYNKANRWRKRGISMAPVRFGIDWTYGSPHTVLVNIYAEDGTVVVSHGGVEIGQGINTKVAQVAAKTLGISLDFIKIKPSQTLTNPNGQGTGGSITSELNCFGTIQACQVLNERIKPVRDANPSLNWAELIQKCFGEGIDLSSKFFVSRETDHRYAYNVYGAAVAEVEVDVLTGQTQILKVDILYDCGQSLNPEIDVGQIEGAFVMGVGYWLTEKIVFDKDSGQLLTHNTWEYKPPSAKDIPITFNVELLRDAPNPVGVLGSKAVGEPPFCLSPSVLFAVKRAVDSARSDAGETGFFRLSAPATVEDIQRACLVEPSTQFNF